MTTLMRKGLPARVLVGAVVLFAALGSCERAPRDGNRVAPSPAAPSPPSAALPADPNQRLDALVRENLNAELAYSPTTATWLGVHGYDEHLDDVRADAQAREATRLRVLVDRLSQIRGLDAQHEIDRLLLVGRAQASLFELTEVRPLERNPMTYVDLANAAVLELLSTGGGDLPVERVRALTARLWKLHTLFDEARRNLRNTTSDLAVRKAIEVAQTSKGFLAETLPKAVQPSDPKLMDDFVHAAADASRAFDDFASWMQRDLLPRARGDFALGRERFLEKLRVVEGLTLPADQLLALGERELKDARRRYDDAAKQIVAGHAGADALKLVEDDHPKADELLAQAQAIAESEVAFVKSARLFTLPEPERPRVVEMPPVLWGFVQLSQPGPLEAHAREAYLYVDPVEKGWPDRRKQEHLRALNRAALVMSIADEVLGHYVEAERDRRAPTTMQKIALAPAFVDGWAHYVQRELVDAGYLAGDPKVRLYVERSTILHAARLVAAVKLHALSGKLEDAIKIFTDEAGFDDYQARREAERVAVDPMVCLDALGRLELAKLRDDYRDAHEGVTLGQIHDAMLAHGSPPVTLLRKILLPDDDRSPL